LARTETISPDTDVLVIGLTSSENGPAIVPADLFGDVLTAEVRAELLDALGAVGAKGKPEELTRVPAPAALADVTSVLAVGLGIDLVRAEVEALRRGGQGRCRAGAP